MPAVRDLKVSMIGLRTDDTGVAQNDWDQEEMRLISSALFRQGMAPNLLNGQINADAFKVRQDSGVNMNVRVGNGATDKIDGYILRGNSSGQGVYVVRLDNAVGYATRTAPATDATNPARYGVYLWVNDSAYGGTASRAYADISVLRGTPAASPTTPGPDAAWSAYALLWEFQLPALATAVTNTILDQSTSYDQRVTAQIAIPTFLETQVFS